MGFRFQKRVSLGRGLGINLSKSGASASVRTKSGSIGTRGFSLRTGIPGLSYRGNWGKGGGAFIALFMLAWGIIYLTVKIVTWIVLLLYQGIMRVVQANKGGTEYAATGLAETERKAVLKSAQTMGKILVESLKITENSTATDAKINQLKIAKEKLSSLRKMASDYPDLEINGLEEAELAIARLESEVQSRK